MSAVTTPSPQKTAAGLQSAAPRAAWLTVWTLSVREVIRFVRQRSRLVGAVGQPVMFWILFGAGLRGSFTPPAWAPAEMTYQDYFFPGIAVLIVMFTAIFSTISIIEDRREGFLQGVLVAPVPRWSITLGKLCGGTALALIQAALFLGLGLTLGMVGLSPPLTATVSPLALAGTLAWLTVIAWALTGLGYLMAWQLDSTQGFHALMSVFLMPLWLLSGAFFPGDGTGWLSWVLWANPLSYGVAGLRRILAWEMPLPTAPGLPPLGTCLVVMLLFAVATTIAAIGVTNVRTIKDAR